MSVIAAGAAAGSFAAATLQGDQTSPDNLAGQFSYGIEKSVWTDWFFHKSDCKRLARIDHRFGNEGDFGRPERFSESFSIDPVQVE